ncbi:hypothetical protein ACFYV7_00055 [Nocardia suismassiliense]|uniref:DUF3558 domain-containing protein n=1 Tax=Nocardia suismassiliense TaxID=2077092 RepID=A0ABW6QKH9_9NOCA
MNPRKLLVISVLAVLLSGCGLLSRTDPERYEIPTSNHTILELCDSAKQFFAILAGTENLKTSPGVGGKALTDKIDGGNGCFYEKNNGSARPSHLGHVSLFRVIDDEHTLSTPPPTNENYPTRVLTVDGVSVKVVTEPLPKDSDPATTRLTVDLAARIDGWDGELHFRTTEGQTTPDAQAGAQVLVDMVRALKG